jgi:hypothetical protein
MQKGIDINTHVCQLADPERPVCRQIPAMAEQELHACFHILKKCGLI